MASGELKKVGSFIGTGAAKEIALDFTPTYVKVVNMTTLDSAEKFDEAELTGKEGGFKRPTGGGAVAALTAAQGITLGERKFTVGTDDAVNKADSHMVYVALR